MPEALRHDRHVDPGGEHQRGLSVPQVVQPHPSQSLALPGGQVRVVLEADGVDQAAEQLGDVIRAQGVAVVMGEHEPVVPVRRLPLAALLLLPQLVTQERADGQLVEVDDPILAARRLWPGEHQTDVSPFAVRTRHGRHVPLLEPGHLHDLLPHDDHPPGEVDVVPSEPTRLTAAQARSGDHLEEGAEAVRTDVVEEGAELGRLPRDDLGALRGRQLDVLRHVEGDELLLHGGRQGAAQRRVNAANGRRLPLPVVDLGEQLVDVRGPQVAQAYAAEVRNEVVVDVVPVRAERRRAPARPLLELHPLLEPLLDGLPVVVGVAALADPGEDCAQLALGLVGRGEPALLELLPLAVLLDPGVGGVVPGTVGLIAVLAPALGVVLGDALAPLEHMAFQSASLGDSGSVGRSAMAKSSSAVRGGSISSWK
ncbi:hypothetical protein OG408_12780 [Streptomyces sp. NBC_01257]|nr:MULTISPECIES: hypothetical protein [unclassified Streptomyces]MCX5140110.1 hypothetical protein [Streptomyces sp. NBC_00338]WRZ64709.1 hypothetical protein OG408_12780 [Streptomyces sp. NBC_01257]